MDLYETSSHLDGREILTRSWKSVGFEWDGAEEFVLEAKQIRWFSYAVRKKV